MFDLGGRVAAISAAPVPAAGPHLFAASYDGRRVRLYVDGAQVGEGLLATPVLPPPPPQSEYEHDLTPRFELAPRPADSAPNQHFDGRLQHAALYALALSPSELKAMAARPPEPPEIGYDEALKPWPVQLRQQAGYDAPQPPATLPRGAPPAAPVAKAPYAGPALPQTAPGRWTLAGGWRLASATDLKGADGEAISQPGYDARAWLAATVPGTVLTTLVDRGVYPDPAYGLNNLAIPESLSRHDWWYRAELQAPPSLAGATRRTRVRRDQLRFRGLARRPAAGRHGGRLRARPLRRDRAAGARRDPRAGGARLSPAAPGEYRRSSRSRPARARTAA